MHEHYITEFSQKIGDFSDDGVVPDSEQRTKVAASAADRSPWPGGLSSLQTWKSLPHDQSKAGGRHVFGKHKQGHDLDE